MNLAVDIFCLWKKRSTPLSQLPSNAVAGFDGRSQWSQMHDDKYHIVISPCTWEVLTAVPFSSPNCLLYAEEVSGYDTVWLDKRWVHDK